jgi:hypothetical protein
VLKNKHIKKTIEDVQKYLIDKKTNQDVDQKIKEIIRAIQNQKLQITVKRRQNEEGGKEDDDYDLGAEESISTTYTCGATTSEPNKRDPSPLWDKNIDELVSIITSNGKSKKKRGHTTIKQVHKKTSKERKENSPELVVNHHSKRSFDEKKIEHRHAKSDLMDVKYWQRFLFESPGTNVEVYNKETEYYMKKIEELARKCTSTTKPLKKPLISKESLNRLRQMAFRACQQLDRLRHKESNI